MYRVPYDKTEIEFELLPGMSGTVVRSRAMPSIANVVEAVDAALAAPLNSAPLRELARAGDRVCIVFTDSTRYTPDKLFVSAILRELHAAGVREQDITLLCGIGMHRPSTRAEKIAKLGAEVVARYRVMDNEPRNPTALVDLGTTESGVPLAVNKIAYEADLLIATGVVEPHQYAGYSGGRKTVAVGAAGEAMIAYTHGPRMLDHAGTRLGRIEGNPFHEAITEAARRAGLHFILNAVLDDEKCPVAIHAGEPRATFAKLVEVARQLYTVPIYKRYDVIIGGVGFPKDVNLYQASRAASYLYFAPTSIVKPGGLFIVPARCAEGAGAGVGEQRFYEEMRGAVNMTALLERLRRTGYPPGAQRAFIMAKVMEQHAVIIVGAECPDIVREVKMIPAVTMTEALKGAVEFIGRDDLDVLIVPHALLTLPLLQKAKRKVQEVE